MATFVIEAHAATIAPTAFDLKILQGETAEHIIVLGNEQQEAETFSIEMYGVQVSETTGEIEFYKLSDDVRSWFKTSEQEYLLEAGGLKEVSINISIPSSAESQTLGVAIQFTGEPANEEGINVISGVASLLFLTIGSDLDNHAELLDFSADKYSSHLPIDFYTTIRNSGSSISQPSGTITIKNLFGSITDVLDFNPNANRVLAGQDRTIQASWGEQSSADGFVQNLSQEFSQFTIGIFTVELNIQPWSDYSEWNSQIRVVVIPWRMLLVALALFILLFSVLKVTRPKNR
ncbi:MAG: hypothetical protein Q8P30_03055 [Candidatus Uhrbacteria bacterium]|nr:hypothetical protein [Candidatus Uhrbacteria bacterium]